jgi:hypothetical protein
MRTRNRCLLVVVFFLAAVSLTARTTTAKIIDPQPPPEAIDPGDPDDNTGAKCTRGGVFSLGERAPVAVRPTGPGMSHRPESDTHESAPAQVSPVHGGDWLVEKTLLILLFRWPLGR